MLPLIEINNISKSFKDNTIIHNCSFEFRGSNMYLIHGDNGSGKSTLIRIMTNLLSPDEGHVYYNHFTFEKDQKKILQSLGVILNDDRCLYYKLSAWENVYYAGRIFGVSKSILQSRMTTLFDLFDLPKDKTLIENFSSGMKRKVAIVRGLVHQPLFLLADEPLNNLDEESRFKCIQVFKQLALNGSVVIVASHIIDDGYRDLFDLILEMKDGKLHDLSLQGNSGITSL